MSIYWLNYWAKLVINCKIGYYFLFSLLKTWENRKELGKLCFFLNISFYYDLISLAIYFELINFKLFENTIVIISRKLRLSFKHCNISSVLHSPTLQLQIMLLYGHIKEQKSTTAPTNASEFKVERYYFSDGVKSRSGICQSHLPALLSLIDSSALTLSVQLQNLSINTAPTTTLSQKHCGMVLLYVRQKCL